VSLVVEAVRSGYGQLEILQGIGLRLPMGQLVGLIGPNGAGKSTLLKTIFGYIQPFAGTIRFDDRDLVGLRPDQILRLGIGFLAQDGGLFPEMTVQENLVLGGYSLRGRHEVRAALDEVYARFPTLRDRTRQLAGSLSGGEQRMLAIGRVLMTRPRLILLDEPSAGLAPRVIDSVYDAIVALNRAAIALLVAEQNVEMILGVAHRVFVLDLGRNAFDGSPMELRGAARLRQLYLGEAG
jgi:branched-chain amino acid transport system ATP-binding protein